VVFPATAGATPLVPTCLAFSGSGQTLAAAGPDAAIRLFNLAVSPPRERFKLEGHADPASSVAYSPNNKLIVTGGTDWTCRSWDITGPKSQERFQPWSHLSHVYSTSISPDCQTLASGSLDRVLRLWDIDRPEPRTRNYLKGDSIPLYQVTFSPDGQRLAASGTTASPRQWEAATGKVLRPLKGLPAYPFSLRYTPDSKQILSHSYKTVFLHDANSGDEVRRFEGHETNLSSVALAPDGKLLLTGSGAVLFKDGKPVLKDGQYVYYDTILRLWDVDKGTEVQTLKTIHTAPVAPGFFSLDSKDFFSCDAYQTTLLRRNVAEPLKAATPAFSALKPSVYSFQLVPDGKTLLTMGTGYQISIWDLPDLKLRYQWNLPEVVGHIHLASDNRHLAVALGTGVIYILRLAPPAVK